MIASIGTNPANVQSMIFSAPNFSMWAWGVWGSQFVAEGIAFSLRSAKQRATEKINLAEAKTLTMSTSDCGQGPGIHPTTEHRDVDEAHGANEVQ